MKISEVDARTGIPRKNIRYYESEGLLEPRRNAENGYRDYSEADVAQLLRIRLLRRLGVPVAEIRQLAQGRLTVGDAIQRRRVLLRRELRDLEEIDGVCALLEDCHQPFSELDAAPWLERLDSHTRPGPPPADPPDTHRWVAPAVICGILLLLLAAFAAFLVIYAVMVPEDRPPLFLLILMLALQTAAAVGLILTLRQRLREIRKGDEYDAVRKY